MTYTSFVLTALLAVVQTSAVKTPARLDGLDRLYFQRTWNPGAALDTLSGMSSLLPERIRESDFSAKTISPEEFFKVRDFRLPSESHGRKLWLRQVIDDRHYRSHELWWALYDHGRRSDVWYFTPLIEGEEKILYNYEIESVSTAGKGSVAFRVRGSRFLSGSWMIVGKVFTFSVSEIGLTFSRVRNAFGFIHWYDSSNGHLSINVWTELESQGRFEERAVTSKQEKTLRRCGFPDPLRYGEPKLSWQKFQRVALCITQRPGAKRSTRAVDQPTFVERGGQPSK